MATEIERKWVCESAPHAVGESMRQGYLARDGDVTLRIRISGTADTGRRAVLTVKAGGGLSRTEVEAEIPVAEAEELWPHTAGRRIEKTRAKMPLDGGPYVAEVDRYAGDLAGLVTVEVEFPSTDAAAAFEAPAWFGREVTGDGRWSNASLSEHGRPD